MAASFPDLIWFNGELMPWQDAKVHVFAHAIHYGSSVFEGIRAYDTPNGPVIFRLPEHARRLFDSARIYRMPIPFSQQQIEQACCDAVAKNRLGDAYLRPIAFRGAGPLGLLPRADHPVEVVVAAFEWGAYLGEESIEQGVDIGVSSWSRLAPNTMPTGSKAGGNYLSSQLIAEEARRHGYTEGLALDVNGLISEGAGENIFVVRNNRLMTPPISAGILPGITRDTIFTLAASLGYEVSEQPIPREALYLADEIFMCGTATEIVPVRSVDGQPVGNGEGRGPITKAIQSKFFGLFDGSTEDEWGWLTPVSAYSSQAAS